MVKHEQLLKTFTLFFNYDYEIFDYHTFLSPKYSNMFLCMHLLIWFIGIVTMWAEDNHTKSDGRLFERQLSFSYWWSINEGQYQGEFCFSGQLALTLAQLRLRLEALWCSTNKTDAFKTMAKQPSRGWREVKGRFLYISGPSIYQELPQWKWTSYHVRHGDIPLSFLFPSIFPNPDPPQRLSKMRGKGGSHRDGRGWWRWQPRPD